MYHYQKQVTFTTEKKKHGKKKKEDHVMFFNCAEAYSESGIVSAGAFDASGHHDWSHIFADHDPQNSKRNKHLNLVGSSLMIGDGGAEFDKYDSVSFSAIHTSNTTPWSVDSKRYKATGENLQHTWQPAGIYSLGSVSIKTDKAHLNGFVAQVTGHGNNFSLEVLNQLDLNEPKFWNQQDPSLKGGKNGSLYITRSHYEELQRNIFSAPHVNLKSQGSTSGFSPLIESFDADVSPVISYLPQQVVNHYDQEERVLKGTSKSRSRAAMFASIAIGVGMNLLLPGSGSVWMAMGSAALSTGTAQMGSGLIMNKGDFGTTFKGMVTPDSLRQLGVSIATAGALNKLGLPTQPQGFTEHFQVNFARSFVSSGLTAATGGCTIKEALKQVGIGTGVGTLGGLGAGYIGDLGDLGVNPIIPEFLHIGLGAGIGAAMSDNPATGAAAGAVGAGVSHLFAHLITPSGSELQQKILYDAHQEGRILTAKEFEGLYQQQIHYRGDIARLVGTGVATAIGLNPNPAFFAANNAIEHNYAFHQAREMVHTFRESHPDNQFVAQLEDSSIYQYAMDHLENLEMNIVPWGHCERVGRMFMKTPVGQMVHGYAVEDVPYLVETKAALYGHYNRSRENPWFNYATSLPLVGSFPLDSVFRSHMGMFPENRLGVGMAVGSLFIGGPEILPLVRGGMGALSKFPTWLANRFLVGAGERAFVPVVERGALAITERSVVDAGITWGGCNYRQGMAWEEYLARQMSQGSRLPKNHNVFDFHDIITLEAVSAKTLNTLTKSRLDNPSRVYYSLKKNIDAAFNFEKSNLRIGGVNAEMITSRTVHVAIPQQTTSAQWQHINRAVEYAKENNVLLKITETQ